MIGLPVGQIVLFCSAIGRDPTGLTLAVTNHELSGDMFSQRECPVYRGCNRTLLSCRYLDTLKKRNNLILVSSSVFDFSYNFSICIFEFLISDSPLENFSKLSFSELFGQRGGSYRFGSKRKGMGIIGFL